MQRTNKGLDNWAAYHSFPTLSLKIDHIQTKFIFSNEAIYAAVPAPAQRLTRVLL